MSDIEEHHIYMAESSRVSIAGLNGSDVPEVGMSPNVSDSEAIRRIAFTGLHRYDR